MYNEVNDINIESDIYRIYFNQLKSRKAKLSFINDIFARGPEVAIGTQIAATSAPMQDVMVDIVYSGQTHHPYYGSTYMCIDTKYVMHISADRLVEIKRVVNSFSLMGYILTNIPNQRIRIKNLNCRFYRAYRIHNKTNTFIPISLS